MVWLKRLAAPKWWPIKRKEYKFVVFPRGPHKKERSLPLLIIIRDVFKLAANGREAKNIIKSRKILVNGKPRRDMKYGVGVLDVIGIPDLKKAWRIVPSKKGFEFIEIDDSNLKIYKILDKKILKKGKIQLNLDSGKNIIVEKQYTTGNSLLIEFPNKIKDHIKLEKSSTVLVISGKNVGTIATIDKIEKENKRAWLKTKEKTFEVPLDLIIVVGKKEPVIKLE